MGDTNCKIEVDLLILVLDPPVALGASDDDTYVSVTCDVSRLLAIMPATCS